MVIVAKLLNPAERLKEDKNYLNKVYLYEFSQSQFPGLMTGRLLSFWYGKDIFHMRVLSPAFRRKKGRDDQSILLVRAGF